MIRGRKRPVGTWWVKILNIMDIILNFLENCIVQYIWLKKKMGTDPDWQALDADPDQDQPLPKLCRSDRIRIHNTGTVTGINAEVC